MSNSSLGVNIAYAQAILSVFYVKSMEFRNFRKHHTFPSKSHFSRKSAPRALCYPARAGTEIANRPAGPVCPRPAPTCAQEEPIPFGNGLRPPPHSNICL